MLGERAGGLARSHEIRHEDRGDAGVAGDLAKHVRSDRARRGECVGSGDAVRVAHDENRRGARRPEKHVPDLIARARDDEEAGGGR